MDNDTFFIDEIECAVRCPAALTHTPDSVVARLATMSGDCGGEPDPVLL